ncbi:hypothetical protein ACFOU2_19320 [Bacillus songklensis]|uniref:Uncharacterized protein n=1 Tax=Bacillus songklensis TaxID=1069116 RepID=A0ABV8B7P8_9BACI
MKDELLYIGKKIIENKGELAEKLTEVQGMEYNLELQSLGLSELQVS